MPATRAARAATVILVLAVCAFFVGFVTNIWVSVVAICIATLAIILAIAFYMQGQ